MLKKIHEKIKVLKLYVILMNLIGLIVITNSFGDLNLHIPLDMNCNDISGNNHDGYFYGDANWEDGVCDNFNQGLHFNEQGDYIEIGDFHYKSSSNEFTLSFWFNVEDNSGYYYKYVFSHGYVGYNNSLNIYFYENGKSDAPLLRTYLKDSNGLPGMSALDINADFCDGTWHLYTLTVSQGDIKVYIDGSIRASANSGGGYFNPYSNIFFGGRNDLNYYRMYGGLLDDIRIYNSKISPEEVYEISTGCEVSEPTELSYEIWYIANSYEKGSIVMHEGLRYFALRPITPGVSIYNSDYWQLISKTEMTQQLPWVHDDIALKLVSHPAIRALAALNKVSYEQLKDYADDAWKLDFRKIRNKRKYGTDFHSAWGGCFAGKKYRTDPKWKQLSEYDRMIYLLHNIGDATVPVGHGVGGKFWDDVTLEKNEEGNVEWKYEWRCQYLDLPEIVPYGLPIDEVLSESGPYYTDQWNTAEWLYHHFNPDNTYDDYTKPWYGKAALGDPNEFVPGGGGLKGGLQNGLSLGFSVLTDYYISKISIKVTLESEPSSFVPNGTSATFTASASPVDEPSLIEILLMHDYIEPEDPEDYVTFQWDIHNDGEFNDGTGKTKTVTYTELQNCKIIRVRAVIAGITLASAGKSLRLDDFDPVARGRFQGTYMEHGTANVLAGPMGEYEDNWYIDGDLWAQDYHSMADPSYNFEGSYDPDWPDNWEAIKGSWDLDNDGNYEIINTLMGDVSNSVMFSDFRAINVEPYEKHTVTLKITDLGGNSTLCPNIAVPILINPELSEYTITPSIFSPKDQIVNIALTTFDRDNYGENTPEPNGGIKSIKWDLNKDGKYADILDYNSSGAALDFTYRELINVGLNPTEENTIKVSISDDDEKLSWSDYHAPIIEEIPITLASPEIGDANCDGFINQADKDILHLPENWEKSTTDDWHDYWLRGDFNQDGIVDGVDEALLENNWIIEFDFSAERVEGHKPFTTSFSANSLGAPVTTWQWDFGDGETATTGELKIIHTYTEEGLYTVKLVGTGEAGTQTVEKVDYITVKPAATYCGSEASSSYYEWIAGVQVGDINNSSGAAGYTDFTSQTAELVTGGTALITLTPGFPIGHGYSEWWKVWIDYNQDGDFDDEGELVFKPDESSQPVTGEFTVPSNVFIGKTRMRVQMMFNFLVEDDPCAYFTYGEVEDYSVFIANLLNRPHFTFNSQECVDGGCTSVGNPVYVADQTGGDALRCDGQSYIAYPDAPEYQMGTGDLSISCWVRTDNYCWPPKSVLDKRYFPTGIGYHLCVVRNCEVLIQLADSTGWSNYNRNSGVTLTDNQWHHIVVTVDRDKPDGIRYYVDGVLRANGNPMDRQGNLDNPSDLLLGGQNDTQDAYFVGDIDNVRLYDKVISEDLITNLYNSKL